jgi:hypothetical protein
MQTAMAESIHISMYAIGDVNDCQYRCGMAIPLSSEHATTSSVFRPVVSKLRTVLVTSSEQASTNLKIQLVRVRKQAPRNPL